MMLNEVHKHSEKISYRWLISNTIWQSLCLVTITLIMFIFDMITTETNDGLDVEVNILSLKVNEEKTSIFDVKDSEVCDAHPATCDSYETMLIGNMILIVCLILSFCFDLAAVYNLAITIRYK